jgi:hypothetical protein
MDTAFPAVLHIRIAKVLQFSGMNMQYCDTSILQYILWESIQKYPCVHAPPGLPHALYSEAPAATPDVR